MVNQTSRNALSPAKKIVQGMAKCEYEVQNYGGCVLAMINSMEKDGCKKQFLALKDCVMKNSGKRW